jgi:thioesterase domain-containing protein
MALDPAEIKKLVETAIPFLSRMGLRVLDIDPGRVRLKVPLAENRNHVGTLYAGALFTLAEIPGGVLFYTAFDPARYYPVLKEMNLRFVKPVASEATVAVELPASEIERIGKELEAAGKCDYVLEAELTDAAGDVVARSRGLYQGRRVGT